MNIRPRIDWKAEPPSGAMTPHSPTRVTVHHTATETTPSTPEDLRAIQRFHQRDRGWPDIAYHYFVASDGSVWEGRNAEYIGDSATDYDLTGHLHVAVLGNFEDRPPTDDQLAATRALVVDLLAGRRLDPHLLAGHRDFAETACPGRHLYPWIGRWRSAALGETRNTTDDPR